VRYPQEVRSEAKAALHLGWTIVLANSGHFKWYDSNGRLQVVMGSTPSKNKRGMLNAKAKLKRLGVKA
jgi:hypothetical protein